jgi:superoxide dismutase, Fe-Mn family
MDTHAQNIGRRETLSLLAVAGMGAIASGAAAQPGLDKPAKVVPPTKPLFDIGGFDAEKGEYVLPALPYKADKLEPHLDKATMELHHGKHHAAYVAGANRAMKELRDIREGGDAGMVRHWARELSFHLGGHVNHTLFWNMMAPTDKGGGDEPSGALAEAIARDFGSLEKFIAHFEANATQVEGGGWGWLVFDTISRRLMLIQMESQQDRFVTGSVPILGIDVWEHAYYLKHQNKRSDYVKAFRNVIHWKFCEWLFERASG